ncbi:MAG: hypothetical protein AMXMBFR64_49280 [Myxococcales bacterium]
MRGAVIGALLLAALGAEARPRSVGSPQGGELQDGFHVPLTGAWHSFYGPVRSRGTNYATLELAALLIRAARVVDDAVPGPPLVIADVSAEGGGDLGRHMSHNSGRDVDVLFYVQDLEGKPVRPRGFVAFDGDGRCAARGCDKVRFDDQRNWWFVRTLLASEDVPVQYVFVSDPLKERLLAYAAARGESPRILRRARKVLQEPRGSSPHADHYHVRIYCSAADRQGGCVDRQPVWPWVKGEASDGGDGHQDSDGDQGTDETVKGATQ